MPLMAVTPSASRRFGHWLIALNIRNPTIRKYGRETDLQRWKDRLAFTSHKLVRAANHMDGCLMDPLRPNHRD